MVTAPVSTGAYFLYTYYRKELLNIEKYVERGKKTREENLYNTIGSIKKGLDRNPPRFLIQYPMKNLMQ
ncbi:MAG: hypothetical protein KF746_28365, partial [Chitinophagaceae bacterium]|nr:hypothetical protein [Chitinophagaceae bacterium]